MAEKGKADRRRITLDLSNGRVLHLDSLKREWGLRNRGDVLERLLDTIFPAAAEESPEADPAQEASTTAGTTELDEQGALVLVSRGAGADRCQLRAGRELGRRSW